MPRISAFGLGVQSRSRAVTAARSQNIYFEPRPMGEKAQIVAYGTPGLTLFANAGDTPWRGMQSIGTTDFMYGVHRGVHYQVDNTGALTSRGLLNTTTGRVDMTHNGTVGFMVDGTDAYTYTIASTTFAEVTDGDMIANPKTCTWLDQYFIIENGSQFQISANGSSWDSTEVAVPESNPDGIVRIFADHGELMIFGDISTEFWTNTGATDFPFAPLKSSTAEWGLAATWSLCKFNDSVACLVKNRMGQASVAKFEGYVPRIISTPDLDEIINSYATVSDATAYSYMLGGHPMYEISFPSAGYSWLYDAFANHWSPRKSANITRQRNEIGIQYLNKTVVSDYASGVLYNLRDDVYTENGEMIERELISGTVANPDLERLSIDRFRIDMETGVGLATGQGSNPQVMLQVSRDGGNSYGAEMWRSAGEIGQYRRRVEWRKLGGAEQFVFKLRMTDPVKFAAVNESVNPMD